MRSPYELHSELDEVLDRAGRLAVRTIIFDVEPLVSWWDNTQESLDMGVAMVVGKVATLPTVRALVFSTNSVRRPTVIPIPAGPDIAVSYLASAAKPLRTAPYRDLPRPGAVVGDQIPTDGLLARRLGYTFLHYQPRLDGIPLGPRLMHRLGRFAVPLLFRGRADHSLARPIPRLFPRGTPRPPIRSSGRSDAGRSSWSARNVRSCPAPGP
jgi:predicted HAD superfamily phosphohydrolase YqeG